MGTITIHSLELTGWFSARKVTVSYGSVWKALKSHLRYITCKAKAAVELDMETWHRRVEAEISKRADARVAGKIALALPNDWRNLPAADIARFVQRWFAERLGTELESVGVAIHDEKGVSGIWNLHAHIVVYPRLKNGKKLRLGRKELSKLHKEWDQTLHSAGYEIKREENPIPHLGPRLRYDGKARAVYLEYLRTKRELRSLQQEQESLHSQSAGPPAELPSASGQTRGKSLLNKVKAVFAKFSLDERQKQHIQTHIEHLRYFPDDVICIVLVSHPEGRIIQRFWRVRELLEGKNLKWLRYMNAQGYSVYATVNTMDDAALEARRRTEDLFMPKQRRIHLDLDAQGKKPRDLIWEFYKFLCDYDLPQPTYIIKTSPSSYQVCWVLEQEVDFSVLRQVMRAMALELCCTRGTSRVLRLPGFVNHKHPDRPLCIRENSIGVYHGRRKIGEIKPTGEPVPFDRFKIFVPTRDEHAAAEYRTKTDRLVERATVKAQRIWADVKRKIDKRRWLSLWGEAFLREGLRYADKVLGDIYREYGPRIDAAGGFNEAEQAIASWLTALGVEPEKVRRMLVYVAKQRKKPNPGYYADLTLKKAIGFTGKPKPKRTQPVTQRSERAEPAPENKNSHHRFKGPGL